MVEPIAGADGHDRPVAQGGAQTRDVRHRRAGGSGGYGFAGPQHVDEPIDADDPVSIDQHRPEETTLLRPTDRDGDTVPLDDHWAENCIAHRRPG